MLTIEDIQEKLRDRNLAEVARAAGVTRSYISAIASGKRVNPSYEMLKKLSEVLQGE
jgi:transcriptional regulator with XRE-family HTH domain